MQWRFSKATYDYLIPKLEKNIYDLSEKEAAEYYAWFVAQIPTRITYISKACAKDLHIPLEKMDCSPESLVLLWRWFRKKAKTEKIIPSLEAPTHGAQYSGPSLPRNQLTLETEYILRDIGMYLGEVFRKNCRNIHWTYYTQPKRDMYVNHPLLQGFVDRSTGTPFNASFEPIHMARVQAIKLLNGKSMDEDLLKLYWFWATMV